MNENEILKNCLSAAVDDLFKYKHALKKIAMRYFDPEEKEGVCVADCEANLPRKNPHSPHCPFKIAYDVLPPEEK